MFEDPEYDVAASNEGVEKADTTELDPRTARLVRRGRIPIPRGMPTEMTAPALVTGTASSETGDDTIVFKARESASAKVCHNGKVLYIDPVSGNSSSKNSYVVWIAQPYGIDGGGVTKVDAIAMVRELCALGRAKLDKDETEKQWVTYRFPQGSRAAKFFNIWLDKTTHVDEDIAKATAVTVAMKSAEGEGAPPSRRAHPSDRRLREMHRAAHGLPHGTKRAPTAWSFKPDSKSTIATQVQYKGDQIQVLVQKSEGNKENYSDEYPVEGAGSQDIQVYVRSLEKNVMRQILTEGEKLEQGREGRRTTVYLANKQLDWVQVLERPARYMKSVVLGHMPEAKHRHLTIGEYLLANMREFLSIEQWYVARGQAYRREYLLEGLPGTGKTSVVLALAGELELDVYMINLSLEGEWAPSVASADSVH
jgi:hypothetical protein